MLDAGLPVLIVAARQCHARASTTLNVYMPMHCPAETGWPPKLCGAGSMRPASLAGSEANDPCQT